MENKYIYSKDRWNSAHTSSFITNTIFQRNPWIVVWWAAAFPGFGHLILCKYLTGFLLMGWEFFINIHAHVNEAIVFSMTGQFAAARDVLDTRWFLIYIGIYVFNMWNCYQITLDLNVIGKLADRSDAPITPFVLGSIEINYLKTDSLIVPAIWSFLTPGLGYFSLNRLPSGFVMLIAFVGVAYKSRLLPAVQATFYGNFHQAISLVDPAWYLFLPSLFCFAIYDVYIQGKSTSELYKSEQSRYLISNYQTAAFSIPFGSPPVGSPSLGSNPFGEQPLRSQLKENF